MRSEGLQSLDYVGGCRRARGVWVFYGHLMVGYFASFMHPTQSANSGLLAFLLLLYLKK